MSKILNKHCRGINYKSQLSHESSYVYDFSYSLNKHVIFFYHIKKLTHHLLRYHKDHKPK